jgi:hypothetical protein
MRLLAPDAVVAAARGLLAETADASALAATGTG